MKAPVSRCRRQRPLLPTRTMDLLGLGDDGTLYVWSTAEKVQPLTRIPLRCPGRIVSGHYVLEWAGKAVTVHCSNLAPLGEIDVQFMCSRAPSLKFSIAGVEQYLLGRVVPDPVKAAEILHMLQKLNDGLVAKQTAPHRKRGKA